MIFRKWQVTPVIALLCWKSPEMTEMLKTATAETEKDTMHYWLRPFEGVQFRFDNLDSPVIRVQLFQIDFQPCPPLFKRIKIFQIDF